jgi:transposase InsO family protein
VFKNWPFSALLEKSYIATLIPVKQARPFSLNRDELLDREIFTTLEEAMGLIEQWRKKYNQVRPHSTRNNRPPAPEAILTVALT